jgi:cell division protein FtsW
MSLTRVSNKIGIRIDWVTVALVLAISLLGLVMVTSASISIASQQSGEPFAYLQRQLFLTTVGFMAAALVFCLRTEWLEKLSLPLLIAAAVLLLAVLVPGIGYAVNGSRRWIRLAGFNMQASEVARVLVLIFIASYAARREKELRTSFAGLAKPLGVLLGFFILLLGEPDFGAATVLFATGFGVLFLAGARLRYVGALGLAGAFLLGIFMMSADYRIKRLTTFLDPWADPFNSGFQLTQSLIAIGRGEWFGVGLGASVQKLFYLPEAHTDFLFAVLAEELGLVGVILTLTLFVLLVWRSLSRDWRRTRG